MSERRTCVSESSRGAEFTKRQAGVSSQCGTSELVLTGIPPRICRFPLDYYCLQFSTKRPYADQEKLIRGLMNRTSASNNSKNNNGSPGDTSGAVLPPGCPVAMLDGRLVPNQSA